MKSSLTICMMLGVSLTGLWFVPASAAQEAPAPPKLDLVPDVAPAAPDDRGQVLGRYLKPAAGEASVVLTSPLEKRHWLQLTPNEPVKSGQTYLALPGCRGELQLSSVLLTLSGVLPETVSYPFLECKIDLHQHDKLALDLTLRRGRIVLTSQAEKPMVRIRFENPNLPEHGEIIDLVLEGKGTQVLIDRGGRFRPGKFFAADPKSPLREPPGAFVGIWVLKGSAAVRYGTVSYALSSPPNLDKLVWSSLAGLKTPERINPLPPMISLHPPLLEEKDESRRKLQGAILKALGDLAREPAAKPIRIRLDVACKSDDVARRIMAIRCFAALGAMPELVECLIDERDPRCWSAVIAGTKHWMAASRDNEYKVLAALQQRFTRGESIKIMELLHGLAKPDALVEFLDNSCPTIRQLAHLNLCEVVPKGAEIPYNAGMDETQRQAAQQQWNKLLLEWSKQMQKEKK